MSSKKQFGFRKFPKWYLRKLPQDDNPIEVCRHEALPPEDMEIIKSIKVNGLSKFHPPTEPSNPIMMTIPAQLSEISLESKYSLTSDDEKLQLNHQNSTASINIIDLSNAGDTPKRKISQKKEIRARKQGAKRSEKELRQREKELKQQVKENMQKKNGKNKSTSKYKVQLSTSSDGISSNVYADTVGKEEHRRFPKIKLKSSHYLSNWIPPKEKHHDHWRNSKNCGTYHGYENRKCSKKCDDDECIKELKLCLVNAKSSIDSINMSSWRPLSSYGLSDVEILRNDSKNEESEIAESSNRQLIRSIIRRSSSNRPSVGVHPIIRQRMLVVKASGRSKGSTSPSPRVQRQEAGTKDQPSSSNKHDLKLPEKTGFSTSKEKLPTQAPCVSTNLDTGNSLACKNRCVSLDPKSRLSSMPKPRILKLRLNESTLPATTNMESNDDSMNPPVPIYVLENNNTDYPYRKYGLGYAVKLATAYVRQRPKEDSSDQASSSKQKTVNLGISGQTLTKSAFPALLKSESVRESTGSGEQESSIPKHSNGVSGLEESGAGSTQQKTVVLHEQSGAGTIDPALLMLLQIGASGSKDQPLSLAYVNHDHDRILPGHSTGSLQGGDLVCTQNSQQISDKERDGSDLVPGCEVERTGVGQGPPPKPHIKSAKQGGGLKKYVDPVLEQKHAIAIEKIKMAIALECKKALISK